MVLVLVVQAAELNYCTNDRSRNNAASVCLSVSLSFGCCFVRHNKDTDDDDDDNLFNCVTILLTSFFLSFVISLLLLLYVGRHNGDDNEQWWLSWWQWPAFSGQEEVQCFN